jgi:hypothetical protein
VRVKAFKVAEIGEIGMRRERSLTRPYHPTHCANNGRKGR